MMTSCNCKPKRSRSLLACIVPTTILVLLPKCPLCIVAYAAWIGVGISASTAAFVRYGVAVACVTALAVVVVRPLVLRR